jgi:glutamyl-tRNA reductase
MIVPISEQIVQSSLENKGGVKRGGDYSYRVLLVGCSFKSAPLAVRELVERKLSRANQSLASFAGVTEHAELITCNRIELVFATKDADATERAFFTWMDVAAPGHFYVHRDKDAIVHLFRVAAGLDSMVLGEDQILGQVRSAGIAARKANSSKGIISSLFDVAGSVGNKAREPLGAAQSRSLSAFALSLALEKLGKRPKSVLLIGSGKTIRLAASELHDAKIHLATRRRALPFPGAVRVTRKQMLDVAKNCDLVISATNHQGYLLKERSLSSKRRQVVLDLAFPRNVDPSLKKGNTLLYNLDDLADATRALPRSAAADRADQLVLDEAERFSKWLVASRLDSSLSDLHRWADHVRREETSAAMRKMPALTSREKEVVEIMGRRLVSKLLASPTKFAKSSTPELPQEERLAVIHRVFGRGDEG